MTDYSDITSDGGMDPRNKLDDAMYRLTVQQRDTAWLELEAWKQRYLALSNSIAKTAFFHANPAITLMPEPESFKAGEMRGAAVERERILLNRQKAHDVDGHCDIVLVADIYAGRQT